MTPTRTEYLHLSSAEKVLFYVLIFLALAVLGAQIWQRWRLWQTGKAQAQKGVGIRGVLRYVLAQRKVRSSRPRSGAPMHLLIFYGFLALFIATTLLAVNTYSPIKFHQGAYFLAYEFTFDLLGLLFVVGVGWAIARRLGKRPHGLSHAASDLWSLALLMALGITGYVLEAARIGNKLVTQGSYDSWDVYSFVGYGLALPMGPVSATTYKGIWWFHALLVVVFLAVLPRMRLRHTLMAVVTAATTDEKPMGRLDPISLEEVEQTGQIGVATAKDYSRWNLMSLDACMECGRCTEVCPANGVGKILNPKHIVQDIRGVIGTEKSVAEAVTEEALWQCTTCNACVEACPVLIRHVDLIVDARRNLVAEGRFSGTGAVMLRQVASTHHAWGQPAAQREDWMKGREIPLCRDGVEFDWLFWVGCAGATDPGAVKTTQATADLLLKAGVKFACLGREEACTGDPARRTGEEFLFQEKAQALVARLEQYGVKRIVTACPHCLNTLLNEYPQFGGNYEVVHHSQLLAQLVREGKLKAAMADGKTTYHDPCYLGRINNESDAPRVLLGDPTQLNDALIPAHPRPNAKLLEPEHYGLKTLCCGAGGGRMWMEEAPDQRPGNRRAEELLATGAKTVALGCPFCRIMLDASIKQVTDEPIELVDVAEALRSANLETPDS